MKPIIVLMLFMGLILTSLVGCRPGAIHASEDTDATLPTQTPMTKPENMTEPTKSDAKPLWGDESNESVKLAKQDLAQRLGVSVAGITVAAVIGQEFSIDVFYCRTSKERIAKEEPPQVISGLSILLSASGRRYEYHASGETVIFCRPLH